MTTETLYSRKSETSSVEYNKNLIHSQNASSLLIFSFGFSIDTKVLILILCNTELFVASTLKALPIIMAPQMSYCVVLHLRSKYSNKAVKCIE